MKATSGLIAALGAAAMLGACADYYGRGPGPGPGYGEGYVGAVALGDCGGFYDDFYGPIDNGCWGDDGGFWYRAHGGRNWVRDRGDHFSHSQVASMHDIHPTGPGSGYHFGGRSRGGGPHGGGGAHAGGGHPG